MIKPWSFLRSRTYWKWTAVVFPLTVILQVVAWQSWWGVPMAVAAWCTGTLLAVGKFAWLERRTPSNRVTRSM